MEKMTFPCDIITAFGDLVSEARLSNVYLSTVPFGNPVVPLEKTRYANVSLRTDRTGITSGFLICISSTSREKLCRLDTWPDMTSICLEEIPSSFAIGSTVERSFSSTKSQFAFESFSECLNSKGFDNADIRAKGVAM